MCQEKIMIEIMFRSNNSDRQLNKDLNKYINNFIH